MNRNMSSLHSDGVLYNAHAFLPVDACWRFSASITNTSKRPQTLPSFCSRRFKLNMYTFIAYPDRQTGQQILNIMKIKSTQSRGTSISWAFIINEKLFLKIKCKLLDRRRCNTIRSMWRQCFRASSNFRSNVIRSDAFPVVSKSLEFVSKYLKNTFIRMTVSYATNSVEVFIAAPWMVKRTSAVSFSPPLSADWCPPLPITISMSLRKIG